MLIKEYKDYCIITYKEKNEKTFFSLKTPTIVLINSKDFEEFINLYNSQEYQLYGNSIKQYEYYNRNKE